MGFVAAGRPWYQGLATNSKKRRTQEKQEDDQPAGIPDESNPWGTRVKKKESVQTYSNSMFGDGLRGSLKSRNTLRDSC